MEHQALRKASQEPPLSFESTELVQLLQDFSLVECVRPVVRVHLPFKIAIINTGIMKFQLFFLN